MPWNSTQKKDTNSHKTNTSTGDDDEKKIIETLKCNARKKNPKNQSQFWIEIHWKKSNDKPPNKVECFDKLNQTRAHNSTESHAVWH